MEKIKKLTYVFVFAVIIFFVYGKSIVSFFSIKESTVLNPSAINISDSMSEEQQVEQSIFNVRKYGAKGDGVTDDYEAIHTAYIDLVDVGGGILYFPTGVYMISKTLEIDSANVNVEGANRNTTIIKAKNIMTDVIYISNVIAVRLSGFCIDGNHLANTGLHIKESGMLYLNDIQTVYCQDKGIFLDSNSWMFNLTNVYSVFNANYGIYVADNCAGSTMRMVVCEENGINLRIGYTRMIGIRECTFQRFTSQNGGNVLIQGGWDITLDTNWFESPRELKTGETYDIKTEKRDPISGGIGQLIRILNNSFHGGVGIEGGITKYCILDDYTDTLITGNFIDGTHGGYSSGYWYINNNSDTKVTGFGNEVLGGQAFILQSYDQWKLTW